MDIDFNEIDIKPMCEDIDDDDNKEELIAKKISLYEYVKDDKLTDAEDILADILSTVNEEN